MPTMINRIPTMVAAFKTDFLSMRMFRTLRVRGQSFVD